MIIVLPTPTGVLVGIDPGTLIKPAKRRSFPVTRDDIHRFRTFQRYLANQPQAPGTHDNEN